MRIAHLADSFRLRAEVHGPPSRLAAPLHGHPEHHLLRVARHVARASCARRSSTRKGSCTRLHSRASACRPARTIRGARAPGDRSSGGYLARDAEDRRGGTRRAAPVAQAGDVGGCRDQHRRPRRGRHSGRRARGELGACRPGSRRGPPWPFVAGVAAAGGRRPVEAAVARGRAPDGRAGRLPGGCTWSARTGARCRRRRG